MMMLRCTLLVLGSALLMACVGADVERFSLSDGHLSFAIPAGWQVREMPGMKEKFVCGPAAAGFAVNINVVAETANMSMEEYSAACQGAMAKVMTGFKVVNTTSFTTAAKIEGIRLVVQSSQGQFQLEQVFFMIPGNGDTKYVLTASALAADRAEHDGVFDAAAQSIIIQ